MTNCICLISKTRSWSLRCGNLYSVLSSYVTAVTHIWESPYSGSTLSQIVPDFFCAQICARKILSKSRRYKSVRILEDVECKYSRIQELYKDSRIWGLSEHPSDFEERLHHRNAGICKNQRYQNLPSNWINASRLCELSLRSSFWRFLLRLLRIIVFT